MQIRGARQNGQPFSMSAGDFVTIRETDVLAFDIPMVKNMCSLFRMGMRRT